MDHQQGPAVERGELCSVLRGGQDERGAWGRMDTWVYMAESLHCSPETITALLLGYTPKTNKQKSSKQNSSFLKGKM